MKSSKLKATLAAVSAIAVMASASTSFAATVTTSSIYNTGDSKKVSVTATVNGAEADKEVTYLVKSGETIVYIDQATATNGTATFAYKIDKSKLADDLSAEVKFGTDSTTNTNFDGTTALGFGKVEAKGDDNVTITYWKDAECTNEQISESTMYAAGAGETIYAKVTVNVPSKYEIASAVINGVDKGTNGIYALKAGETITVTTKAKTTTPVVVTTKPTVDNDVKEFEGKEVNASVTTVLNVTGTADEYGVLYTVNGELTAFPAAAGTNNYAAVRILTTDNETITLDQVIPYYKVNGTYYNATDGAALSK